MIDELVVLSEAFLLGWWPERHGTHGYMEKGLV
jgi:hypothetical protein